MLGVHVPSLCPFEAERLQPKTIPYSSVLCAEGREVTPDHFIALKKLP